MGLQRLPMKSESVKSFDVALILWKGFPENLIDVYCIV